jgi:hypothetical protein
MASRVFFVWVLLALSPPHGVQSLVPARALQASGPAGHSYDDALTSLGAGPVWKGPETLGGGLTEKEKVSS